MFKTTILAYTLLAYVNPLNTTDGFSFQRPLNYQIEQPEQKILITKSISLENRYDNAFVNNVFKDNILLTLNYMTGAVKDKSDIDWDVVEKPRTYRFILNPNESFAFHEKIKKDLYKEGIKTTNAHFNYSDGFKSDGYLMGDGVCHLASLIYWAAKDAGIKAVAPTNHDFAKINGVPKEYGVSIYYLPDGFENSSRQNLYISNNLDKSVSFVFNYDGKDLTLNIVEL